jgi:hypothetical protein
VVITETKATCQRLAPAIEQALTFGVSNDAGWAVSKVDGSMYLKEKTEAIESFLQVEQGAVCLVMTESMAKRFPAGAFVGGGTAAADATISLVINYEISEELFGRTNAVRPPFLLAARCSPDLSVLRRDPPLECRRGAPSAAASASWNASRHMLNAARMLRGIR